MGRKVSVMAAAHSNTTVAQATAVSDAAATFLAALLANGFSSLDTKVEVLSEPAPTPED